MSVVDLLRYWRACLLDGQRHVDWRERPSFPCPSDAVRHGHLPRDVAEEVWADAATVLKRDELGKRETVSVLIMPVVLAPLSEHGRALADDPRTLVPVWVPAELSRNGLLRPSQADPLVDRGVLAPLAGGAVTFGTVAALDRFLETPAAADGPAAWRQQWPALWAHLDDLFAKVFEQNMETFRCAGYVLQSPYVRFGQPPARMALHLEKLYDRLIAALTRTANAEPEPPLLRTLAAPRAPRPRSAPPEATSRHLAQMGAAYPLNAGQREALCGALDTRDGEITAVNGPPGTGKTTLLQSIVASTWVEAAVAGGEPPVIVATSTNNQAITNILETFTRAEPPAVQDAASAVLGQRWLPEVEDYGLYLPSERKGDEAAERFHVAYGSSGSWKGLPATMETDAYVETARETFLSAFRRWSGRADATVAEAVADLHRDLSANAAALRAAQTARADLAAIAPASPAADPRARVAEESAAHGQRSAARQAALAEVRVHLAEHARAVTALGQVAEEALALIEPRGWFETLFAWLPPVRRRQSDRTRRLLVDHGLNDPRWTYATVLRAAEIRAWLDDRRRLLDDDPLPQEADDTRRRLEDEQTRDDAALAQLHRDCERLDAAEDAWRHALVPLFVTPRPDDWLHDAAAFEAALDVEVRPWLFHQAARYWEGRWLLDAETALTQPKAFTGQARRFREAGLRRFCKVTPCLVATTHMLPKYMDCYDPKHGGQPLIGVIDLLIVEEAGQVAAELGAPLLALAKRAVVVGDKDQIEPVWSVTAAMDVGNATERGLDVEVLEERGMSASTGSMMLMARAVSAISSTGEAGLFLGDHWRCRAGIVAFCNDLVYRHRLRPCRPEGDHPLPPLGYAHVPGRARRRGTSWTNEDEAAVVARWVRDRRAMLLDHHGADTLKEVVGIVTPFKAQIAVLRRALRREGLDADEITVGTVHALQGAERPVVIFSAVYGQDHRGPLFFDRGPNMLNVAASRARDAFLVFGAMGLFRKEDGARPSAVLARHLFADPANEVTDVEPLAALLPPPQSATFQRIATLEEHRAVLREAIETARERLLVVSPYLSRHALEADGLTPLLRDAVARRVEVTVVNDGRLNADDRGQVRPAAAEARSLLVEAGVRLWTVDGIHTKTLAVDEVWIVEGSFNWLSAARDRGSKWYRAEASLLYRGTEAAAMVDAARRAIGGLRVMAEGVTDRSSRWFA